MTNTDWRRNLSGMDATTESPAAESLASRQRRFLGPQYTGPGGVASYMYDQEWIRRDGNMPVREEWERTWRRSLTLK